MRTGYQWPFSSYGSSVMWPISLVSPGGGKPIWGLPTTIGLLDTHFTSSGLLMASFSLGALFTNLAPTAIALASYFCIADMVLISQCTYYNTLNARRRKRHEQLRASQQGDPNKQSSQIGGPNSTGAATGPTGGSGGNAEVEETTEESPLLSRQRHGSSSGGGAGGSLGGRRHSHHSTRRHSEDHDPLSRIVTAEGEIHGGTRWLHNTLGLAAVYAVGVAGWFVSWRMGFWEADPGVPDPGDAVEPTAVVGMVLGYLSALGYLWYVFTYISGFSLPPSLVRRAVFSFTRRSSKLLTS